MVRKCFVFLLICMLGSLNLMAAHTTKKIIAHRGLSGSYPENTLIAFKEALRTQALFLELDIHLSKDQKVVVMHDEDLSRTTNGRGLIRDYTLAELKKFSAGYSKQFGDQFSSEKIPTLLEVLELLEPSDKSLLIEIKSHDDDPDYNNRIVGPIVYQTVMKPYSHLKNRLAFISFNVSILESIRELDSEVRLGPIFNAMPKTGSLADQALRLKSDIVIFSKKLLLLPKVFKKTNQVKHFVYTVDPKEFNYVETIEDLYGYATNYADQLE